MGTKCVCHINGYQIKDAVARKDLKDIQDIIPVLKNSILEQNYGNELRFWVGTLEEYNALETNDKNCFYIITDDTSGEDILKDIEDLKKALEENKEFNKTKYKALYGATPIPVDSDINSYLSVGEFTAQNKTQVATFKNCPVDDVSFRLTVENLLGESTTLSPQKYDYFLQTIKTTDGREFVRPVISNGSGSPIYSEWKSNKSKCDLWAGSQKVEEGKNVTIKVPGINDYKMISINGDVYTYCANDGKTGFSIPYFVCNKGSSYYTHLDGSLYYVQEFIIRYAFVNPETEELGFYCKSEAPDGTIRDSYSGIRQYFSTVHPDNNKQQIYSANEFYIESIKGII